MSEQRPEAAMSSNERVMKEFRDNNGKVGGMFEGAPMVLVTTAGRKTGRPHTNPAIYLRDGDRYLVFCSNAGGPRDPDWYHNLLANPQVTMEIGTEEGFAKPFATRAVPLEGDERDHFWELQCSIDPAFRAYEEKTTRRIPVVALYPLDLSQGSERNRVIGEQLILHHDELRAELGRVRSEIERVLAGGPDAAAVERPAADLTDQLRRHCLTFCYGLQLHHTRENGAFSAFERQFPHLAPVIDRLREEHRVVEKALADFEALVGQGLSGDLADVEKLRSELDQVVSGLEEHFVYEEEYLLPAVDATRSS
jgi:deazaflavin-dependent oxidoreductase (nitroreductase family)